MTPRKTAEDTYMGTALDHLVADLSRMKEIDDLLADIEARADDLDPSHLSRLRALAQTAPRNAKQDTLGRTIPHIKGQLTDARIGGG